MPAEGDASARRPWAKTSPLIESAITSTPSSAGPIEHDLREIVGVIDRDVGAESRAIFSFSGLPAVAKILPAPVARHLHEHRPHAARGRVDQHGFAALQVADQGSTFQP